MAKVRRLERIALLALLLGAGACAEKATFVRDQRDLQAEKGVEREEWLNFWMFGLVGEQDREARQLCPDGRVAEVRTHGDFGTGLVTLLTVGIYAPRKISVTCEKYDDSAVQLESDQRGRIVHLEDGWTPATARAFLWSRYGFTVTPRMIRISGRSER
jgi:hypothetical protein